jgi:hypothetical protein
MDEKTNFRKKASDAMREALRSVDADLYPQAKSFLNDARINLGNAGDSKLANRINKLDEMLDNKQAPRDIKRAIRKTLALVDAYLMQAGVKIPEN